MPKGKRKGKFEHRRTEQVSSSDEDAGIDLTTDNMSETSGQSDVRSNDDNENDIQEKLEEKILEAIDNLNSRSAAARATTFDNLRTALQRRYFAHVLESHRATLADHVSRALRRGKDGEKKAAASIAPLLALQIGEDGADEFVKEVRPALTAAAADRVASIDARTECCAALAALCYMLEEDLTEILEVMRVYESIFSGSYLKGDGSVKVSGAVIAEAAWHAAAIDGWALLLSLLPSSHALTLLTASSGQRCLLERLAQLLETCSLEVRLAAGGALAMAYELVTENDEQPAVRAHIDDILPLLDELSKDSHKYRAKRDRKIQRATFRDIIKYFEDDTVPSTSVSLGAECVVCSRWASRAAYAALAAALGAGLRALAPHVAALRDALALPAQPPPARAPTALKADKLQRQLQNAAACKARTVARNKNRDKRSAALAL